jgi:xanthine dehydrogenase YagR molybdenum-binding subunit
LRAKLYDWVEEHEAYQKRPKADSQTSQRYRRGIGISFGQWLYFYDPDTTVRLESSPSGFRIKLATQDIGNGVKTSLARIDAQTFGVEPESINLEIGSSNHPHGPTAGGSRVTPSVYAPTEQAAQLMKDRLFGVVAEEFDLNSPKLVDGGLQHQAGFLSWAEALQRVPPQHVEVKRGGDNLLQGAMHGIVFKRVLGLDIMIGQGSSQGAVIAEVEVDTLLGRVRVTRVWENLAIGKVHFPDMAMSQVKGGVYQGMGYALYEEKIFDPKTAALLTSNLQDYRLPGIGDIPEVHCQFTDGGFDHVKGKGIGLSELSTMPVAAAIANAVFNATGVRCYESPIKPERLIHALHPEMAVAHHGGQS